MPMKDNDLVGEGWDAPDAVRRTLVLPGDLERVLAEAAHELGVSPHTLLRRFVAEGLARLTDEKTDEAREQASRA